MMSLLLLDTYLYVILESEGYRGIMQVKCYQYNYSKT